MTNQEYEMQKLAFHVAAFRNASKALENALKLEEYSRVYSLARDIEKAADEIGAASLHIIRS